MQAFAYAISGDTKVGSKYDLRVGKEWSSIGGQSDCGNQIGGDA
jgi:hypothetical protein